MHIVVVLYMGKLQNQLFWQ